MGRTLRKAFRMAALAAALLQCSAASAEWSAWTDLGGPPDTSLILEQLAAIEAPGGGVELYAVTGLGIWRGTGDPDAGPLAWQLAFSSPAMPAPGYPSVVSYTATRGTDGRIDLFATTFPDFLLWRAREDGAGGWTAPALYSPPAGSGALWYLTAAIDAKGRLLLFAKGDKGGDRALWVTQPPAGGGAAGWSEIALPADPQTAAIHLGAAALDAGGRMNLFMNVGVSLHDHYRQVWHLEEQTPGALDWLVQVIGPPAELRPGGFLTQPLKVSPGPGGGFDLFSFGDGTAALPDQRRLWRLEQEPTTRLWAPWDGFVTPPFATAFQPPHSYPQVALARRAASGHLALFTTDAQRRVWSIFESAGGWGDWAPVAPPGTAGPLEEVVTMEEAAGTLGLFGIESDGPPPYRVWATRLVSRDLEMGELPDDLFEALRLCSDACVAAHCSGPRPILTAEMAVEIFAPDPPEAAVCSAAAERAVEGREALSVRVVGTGLEIAGAEREPGYFWASEYLACQDLCRARGPLPP